MSKLATVQVTTKASIEPHRFSLFMCWYEERDLYLRLGQAFHQYFELSKSTAYKDEFDRLYQMDGGQALEYIHELFTFN